MTTTSIAQEEGGSTLFRKESPEVPKTPQKESIPENVMELSKFQSSSPFPFIAVHFNPVIEHLNLQRNLSPRNDRPLTDRIFLRDKHRFVPLKLEDIYYIKADRCYSEIHSCERKYISSESLTHFQKLLPAPMFIRVHRSWIINIHFIDAIAEFMLEVQGRMIPVGKTYKKPLKTLLNLI